MLTDQIVAEKQLVVVCAGNLIRSPIAATLLHRAFTHVSIRVVSAGLDAVPGSAVPERIVNRVLVTLGIDLSTHRAQPVSPSIVHTADLLLVMQEDQCMRLAQQYPRQTAKMRLLSELIGRSDDIPDPTCDVEVERVARQIQQLVQTGKTQLYDWLYI